MSNRYIRIDYGFEGNFRIAAQATLEGRVFGDWEQFQLEFVSGFFCAVAHFQYLRHVKKESMSYSSRRSSLYQIALNLVSAQRIYALIVRHDG